MFLVLEAKLPVSYGVFKGFLWEKILGRYLFHGQDFNDKIIIQVIHASLTVITKPIHTVLSSVQSKIYFKNLKVQLHPLPSHWLLWLEI